MIKSFYCRYGRSPANQRIESWWSQFRRNRSNWWINLFKDMLERGILNTSNPLQMECLWFCFSEILKQEMKFVKEHWNSHYIRRSRRDTVAGRPDVLYFLTEYNDVEDHMKPLRAEQIQEMSGYCYDAQEIEDNVYQEYFTFLMEHGGILMPTSWEDAIFVYQQLLSMADPPTAL